MRSVTEQIMSAKIANGDTKSQVMSLNNQTLLSVVVPTGSSLDGKTGSFVQVVDGFDYDVVKDDGTPYTFALAAGKATAVSKAVAESLSQFKIKVNSAVSADGYAILIGLNV